MTEIKIYLPWHILRSSLQHHFSNLNVHHKWFGYLIKIQILQEISRVGHKLPGDAAAACYYCPAHHTVSGKIFQDAFLKKSYFI